MDDHGKRVYSSDLRAAHARQTRRTIVAAAAGLFVQVGFGSTTIDAIAQAAGVSRRTVFTSVGGKVDVLKLALDWAVVGDDEPIPLEHRPEVDRLLKETDPVRILCGWARVLTMIGSRTARLSSALTVAAGVDPAARALWEQAQAQRLDGARAVVSHLAANDGLRHDLSKDEAADIAWVYSDPGLYRRLVIQRGWSTERFELWLCRTIAFHLCSDSRSAIADAPRSPRSPDKPGA